MKRWQIILIIVSVIFVLVAVDVGIKEQHELVHKKLNDLIVKEKYLKIVLTDNKYSGYLAIKSHYEKKLMAYAKKHKGDKFVLALAEKEEAEIEYYKGDLK